jgi:C1A family cysteine protease
LEGKALKKTIFKKSLLVLLTLVFTLTAIFGISQVFAVSTDDSQRELLNNGKGYTKAELKEMRNEIKENGYEFTVGNNKATKYNVAALSGLEISQSANLEVNSSSLEAPTLSLPSSYDLRDYGLTSVKDQGSCGSCWAFATAGVVENLIQLYDGKTTDLSEQWLINCNTEGYGCNGGWFTFDMYENPGSVYEADFPYVAYDGYCKTNLTYHEQIDNYAYVNPYVTVPSTTAIKTAIYNYGPVAAAVYANDSFSAYTSGVYTGSSGTVNHGIILVGWDDSKGAWILRNSWSSGWGENGYMYIKYGTGSVGYASMYAVY